ncbi:MAG: DNA mismatch repair endonuclease MutL [Candidatus Babeliales bacterium]
MNRIRYLSPQEAQKIAAGEVVERPANIVKELVENALDAHASKITILIHNGGKDLIRISDDGEGITFDDAPLAFAHHATSKISSIDQLNSISSFGFRGEALSSIAAVSSVTLHSMEKEATVGVHLEITNGIITQHVPWGGAKGTDISIKDLFNAIPVRKKFLKSHDTEWRHIRLFIKAMSLQHYTTRWTLQHNEEKQPLHLAETSTLLRRIQQIYPETIVEHLIELHATDHGITIKGYISDHIHANYTRDDLFFFVNNRWIKNYILAKSALKAYNNVLPSGKYPTIILFISLDPSLVDINVHPRKEEVRFVHPNSIMKVIHNTLKQALENHLSHKLKKNILLHTESGEKEDNRFINTNIVPNNHHVQRYETGHTQTMSIPTAVETLSKPSLVLKNDTVSSSINTNVQQDLRFSDLQEHRTSHSRIIGIYCNTYIVVEQSEGVMFIDQHAAHERILYELFAKESHLSPITLAFPETISVSSKDLDLITTYQAFFLKNGITLEHFGIDKVRITTCPQHLKNRSLKNLLPEILATIKETSLDNEQTAQAILTKALHAQMACKAAIKAGDVITHTQAIQLIDDLYKTPNRFSCPHGRPTCWTLSHSKIERLFKRIQ